MPVLEAAAVALGASVTRVACAIWLGEPFEAAMGIRDLLKGHIDGKLEERKAARFFDDCADVVAKRVLGALEQDELSAVPANEREAAVLAVSDLFVRAGIADRTLFAQDLDPRRLERHLEPDAQSTLAQAGLSDGGEFVFRFILREACAYLVQTVSVLPNFATTGMQETLRRQSLTLERLQAVLDRLPQRRDVEDFAADYLRIIATAMDRMEIFGARLHGASHAYPLSIAFLTLTSSESGLATIGAGGRRVDRVLRGRTRVMVIGEAGSGKTTLLRWLAVRAAADDFPADLADWSGLVPFVVTLRRYVDRDLPQPEEFVAAAPTISGEMPAGWVHRILREGRGLVLIDGVDELPDSRRADARRWLCDLIATFPRSVYIVSSRPEALDEDWLLLTDVHAQNADGFAITQLEPMSPSDVREFIRLWHRAVRAELRSPVERAELENYERAVVDALNGDRHLRRLAVNPLLCALLCALNRELRMRLPRSRMEVYDAALTMLLDQRDRERGVDDGRPQLTKSDKVLLVQALALWLVRNGRSDASTEEVVSCFADTLRGLQRPGGPLEPEVVFDHLLERSGVLREPVAGRIDFVHRTFQEYLAGKAAVEANGIGELIRNADDGQWREVVVMAAGHAQPHQAAELMEGLLLRTANAQDARTRLIAVACLQSVRTLDPELRLRVEESVRDLMPPQSLSVAETLAAAGDFVLDLLPVPRNEEEYAGVVMTAQLIGGDDALTVLSRLAANPELAGFTPIARFLEAWNTFDYDRYAKAVMAHLDFSDWSCEVDKPEQLRALRHVPTLRDVALMIQPDSWRYADPLPPAEFVVNLTLAFDMASDPWSREVGRWQTAPVEEVVERIAEVRRLKEEMIDAQDFERAAQLRDDEKALLYILRLRTVAASLGPQTFRRLDHLSISGPPIHDFRAFPITTAARRLTIGNWMSVTSFEGLGGCSGVRQLSLLHWRGGQVDLSPLESMRSLTVLVSRATAETAGPTTATLGALARHPQLREIVWATPIPLTVGPIARSDSLPPLIIRVTPSSRIHLADAAGGNVRVEPLQEPIEWHEEGRGLDRYPPAPA